MAKKILTLLLSVIMVASVVLFVASCSGNNEKPETTAAVTTASRTDTTTKQEQDETTTAEVTEEDITTETESTALTGREKMPGYEDVDFGGFDFLISSNCDGDDSWEDGKDFWVESLSNDSVNDAVWDRNDVMHNQYNCTISELCFIKKLHYYRHEYDQSPTFFALIERILGLNQLNPSICKY